MFINIVVAFIFPWLLVIFFANKVDKLILSLIAPLGSVLAFTIDELGFYFGYWNVIPFDEDTIAELPFNLGIYSIFAFLLIFLIHKYKYPTLTILIFSLITTLLEFIYLLIGRVEYGNGWNIGWTFVSYLVPYYFLWRYYKLLLRLKIFKRDIKNTHLSHKNKA